MVEKIDATQNRTDALGIVAMGAVSLFIAVGGYVINQHSARLDRAGEQISALEVDNARLVEHADAHDKTASHWIQKIRENETRSLANQRRIDRLETRPEARAKAFTSDDGKRLEIMINSLQEYVLQRYNIPTNQTNKTE